MHQLFLTIMPQGSLMHASVRRILLPSCVVWAIKNTDGGFRQMHRSKIILSMSQGPAPGRRPLIERAVPVMSGGQGRRRAGP